MSVPKTFLFYYYSYFYCFTFTINMKSWYNECKDWIVIVIHSKLLDLWGEGSSSLWKKKKRKGKFWTEKNGNRSIGRNNCWWFSLSYKWQWVLKEHTERCKKSGAKISVRWSERKMSIIRVYLQYTVRVQFFRKC